MSKVEANEKLAKLERAVLSHRHALTEARAARKQADIRVRQCLNALNEALRTREALKRR
jgi:hypothetical protein